MRLDQAKLDRTTLIAFRQEVLDGVRRMAGSNSFRDVPEDDVFAGLGEGEEVRSRHQPLHPRSPSTHPSDLQLLFDSTTSSHPV